MPAPPTSDLKVLQAAEAYKRLGTHGHTLIEGMPSKAYNSRVTVAIERKMIKREDRRTIAADVPMPSEAELKDMLVAMGRGEKPEPVEPVPAIVDEDPKRLAREGHAPGHWDSGTAPGYLMGKVTVQRSREGEVERTWERQSPEGVALQQALDAAIESMSQALPRAEPVVYTGESRADLCNLYTFTDYHLGMLAWGVEAGADWDLKIAEKMLWTSFEKMVTAAPDADTCVLNIQGDFLHSDGLLPLTPQNKHVLDTDGRFSKIVDAAIRVLRMLIRRSLEKHQHVHLMIVEGNHDETSSLWLRKLFALKYEDEPRMTVNDSELPYYVYQHGEVMLAFHHGHKIKNEQLPGLFAAQFSRMWGATVKRYCHTGHRHHLDEKEYSGMIVTQHPTLSARDAYAARGGWIAERAAIAITYHCTAGQYARTYISPEIL